MIQNVVIRTEGQAIQWPHDTKGSNYKKALGIRNWWNKLDSTPQYLCRCIDQLPKAVYDKKKGSSFTDLMVK